MCLDPVSMTTLAIAAVSQVAGVVGQSQQANAAARAQNAYNRQQEANELAARNANLQALEQERLIAQEDTREQLNQNALAERRALATARVAAGEAGVSGLSVDALLRDLSGQAAYDNVTATENYARREQDINARRENVQRGYANNLSSIRHQPIQSPDYLGAALRIGQAGVNAYADTRARAERLKSPQTR